MKKRLAFRRTMSRVGLCYFVLMLITQALQMAGVLLLPSLLETGWGLWLISYVPLYGAAVPVFLLMLKKLLPDAPGAFGSASLSARDIARWLVLCFGTTYLLNYVSLGITTLLSLLKGGDVANPLQVMQESSSPLAMFLFACVLAPVGEELLFRKLLFDKIGRFGARVYVLAGGLVFALFHANLSQLLYAFVLGAMFCYIYVNTGRLRDTILLHVALNTVGSLVMPLLVASESTAAVAAAGVFILASIAAGIVIAVRRRWKFAPMAPASAAPEGSAAAAAETADGAGAAPDAADAAEPDDPAKHTFGRALCAPGMLAYIVLCALLIVVVTFLS